MNKDLINQQAAQWVARLQSGDCSERERQACMAWRRANPVHDAAYLNAERLFDMLAGKLPPVVLPVSSDKSVVLQPVSQWLMAACLCLAVALVLVVRWSGSDTRVLENSSRQVQHVTLSDGSAVQLDALSKLSVRMQRDRREITLLRGRALFDVRHDRQRPFVVNSQGYQIEALGTVFQVAQHDGDTVVTLTEGAVSVTGQAGTSTLDERLMPGEQLVVSPRASSGWQRGLVDTEQATSWALGRHLFRDVTLAELVREVNRYASLPVLLGSEELDSLRISGSFDAGDTRSIARAVAWTLDLRLVDSADAIILFAPL